MPMLRFKGIEVTKICKISKELIDELQELIQRPRDHFTIEVDQAVYIKDGEIVEGAPVVEVSWFDREQEIQDKAAKIITKHVNYIEYPNVDVIFFALDKSRYYENGQHF
jgi:hypothetical protein